jgi:HD-like signal output (HDOD) protein
MGNDENPFKRFFGFKPKAPVGPPTLATKQPTPVPLARAAPPPKPLSLAEFMPPNDVAETPEQSTQVDLEPLVTMVMNAADWLLEATPPAFPFFASQVLEAAQRPDIDIAQLANLISRDGMMATQVLKVANSTHYARGSEVIDLHDAITRLGLHEVASLAAITSTEAMVNPAARRAADDYPALWRSIWSHSVSASVGGAWLAMTLGGANVPAVFMGGLLHSVGKLVGLQALGHLIHSGKIPRLDARDARRLLSRVYVEIGSQTARVSHYPEAIRVICDEHRKEPWPDEPFRRERCMVTLVCTLDHVMSGVPVSDAFVDVGTRCATQLRLDHNNVASLAERLQAAHKMTNGLLTPLKAPRPPLARPARSPISPGASQ